jgi:hypothetical protein
MTTDASQSYFPSLPPTFGWRRVVELADEFKLSTADMLTICDRLGVTAIDASQWLDAATVDRIRDVVGLKGPGALLKEPKPSKAAPRSGAPEMGSVSRDGVRTRTVIATALLIVALAVGIGVVVEQWVDVVTNTDAPATVVTSDDE